jgi:hypothetical protein
VIWVSTPWKIFWWGFGKTAAAFGLLAMSFVLESPFFTISPNMPSIGKASSWKRMPTIYWQCCGRGKTQTSGMRFNQIDDVALVPLYYKAVHRVVAAHRHPQRQSSFSRRHQCGVEGHIFEGPYHAR